MTKPAIFLDRDGTLIEDAGYLRHTSQVTIYPYTIEALLMLQEHFMLFIISNQSGIAKGLTTQEEVVTVNKFITDTLREAGIHIADVYFCPHISEDNCQCKKPKTYFIEEAHRIYQFDLTRSYIIGDHPSDIECGYNAGITPLYILTGHGEKHLSEIKTGTLVFNELLEASRFVLSKITTDS